MESDIQTQIDASSQRAVALYRQGKYEEAIPWAIQAIGLSSLLWGEEHPAVARALNNLAPLHAALGNMVDAERQYRQSLELNRNAGRDQHPDYATSLNGLAEIYRRSGRYTEAQPLYLQALDILEADLEPGHPFVAYTKSNLAALDIALGRYNEAEQLLHEAQAVRLQIDGARSASYAIGMLNLAAIDSHYGKYAEAEDTLRQAITIFRETVGEDDPQTAMGVQALAELYVSTQQYSASISHFQKALAIQRKFFPPGHPEIASTMSSLAKAYAQSGQYADAEALAQQAITIFRETVGEDDPQTAMGVQALAELYVSTQQYSASISHFQKALAIQRKFFPPGHPEIASTMSSLAKAYAQSGQYADAEALAQQAITIQRETLGEESPNVAYTLDVLAHVRTMNGDYSEAEELYLLALGIKRKIKGREHPDVAITLNNLAEMYRITGRFDEAEKLIQEGLEIRRRYIGEVNREVAGSLMSLAQLQLDTGEYAQARALIQKATDMFRQTVGDTHLELAHSLNTLALLYRLMGSLLPAKGLYEEALKIRQHVLGEQHPETAQSLNNLGVLHSWMGEPEHAMRFHKQALEIRRQALGYRHADVAQSLGNLASAVAELGDYDSAMQLEREALQIRRSVLGEKHPDVGIDLNNLGFYYRAIGDFEGSKMHYQQALALWRDSLGAWHPKVAGCLSNLAIVQAAQSDTRRALDLELQSANVNDRMIGQVFSVGSESQRLIYLNTLHAELEIVLSLIFSRLSDTPEAKRAALDLALRRKGLTLEALAVQQYAVLSGRYPALASQLRDLRRVRMQISQWTLVGSGSEGPQVHALRLKEWEVQRDQLEMELARQIPEMNLEQQLQGANRQEVTQHLIENSALTEIVRFNVFDFRAIPARGEPQWKAVRYAAFVLHANNLDDVQMIDLGEADQIDQLIASFRAGIAGGPTRRSVQVDEPVIRKEPREGEIPDTVRRMTIIEASRELGADPEELEDEVHLAETLEVGRKLRAVLFDPLLPALGGCTRVFLAPDGDLTRLPLEVLPTDDGHYLIDSYRISYLGVGRDVLRFGTTPTRHASAALVVADPDFDLAAAPNTVHSFPRLQGTQAEGQEVANMLGVQPIMRDEAVESRIKDVRSPRILHLATHGFFLPDQPHDQNEEFLDTGVMGQDRGGGNLGRLTGRRLENSLLRSGLALAGANTWLSNQEDRLPPEAEDGLLTAEDVSGMDLLDTELVVLSACETGLGDIHVGEGVFGLRRAFVVAGARTLVMSLWKVPDQATRELMEEFYRRLLQGEARADALRGAQLWMKERHPHPRDWGAFICQGDPGPMARDKWPAVR